MELAPDDLRPVINRLKRAQGQLGGVIRLLEEGADCQAVVTQLAATSRALDRAGFAILSSGLQQCVSEEGRFSEENAKTLEKLFLTLS